MKYSLCKNLYLHVIVCVSLFWGYNANALEKDEYFCLPPETGSYISSILPLDGEIPAAMDQASIERDSVTAIRTQNPALTIKLAHFSSADGSENISKSKNFSIILQQSKTDQMTLLAFAQVVEYIREKDKSENIWSVCKRDGFRPEKEKPIAPAKTKNIAASGDEPFFLNLTVILSIVYLLVFLLLILLGIFWKRLKKFRENLDRKSRKMRYQTQAEKSNIPVISAVLLVCLLALPFVYNTGVSSEMLAPLNFYSYQYLRADTDSGEVETADCSDGFFRQSLRPVFGFCAENEQQYALFYNNYTPATLYLPLRFIGDNIPFMKGMNLKWLMLPILCLTLLLFGFLFSRDGNNRIAALAIVLMAAFPGLIVYVTFFLFETYTLIFALLLWLLLVRYNRTGRKWSLLLAFFVIGLSFHAKVTALLLLCPLVVAYVAVYGLRKVKFFVITAAFLVATIMPALFFYLQHLNDPHFESFSETLNKFTPASYAESEKVSKNKQVDDEWRDDSFYNKLATLSTAMLLGTPFFNDPQSLEALLYLLLFGMILLYIINNLIKFVRKKELYPPKAFFSLLFAGILPFYILVYQGNIGSIPLYQFLPFLTGLIAFMISDAYDLIRRKVAHPKYKLLIIMMFIFILTGFAYARWSENIRLAKSYSPMFTRADQVAVAEQLIAHRAFNPLSYNSFFCGVFEFVSDGKIRPKYINRLLEDSNSPQIWQEIIAKTSASQADFLFLEPCNELIHSCRHHQHSQQYFYDALKNVQRDIVNKFEITDSYGKKVFLLIRIAAQK